MAKVVTMGDLHRAPPVLPLPYVLIKLDALPWLLPSECEQHLPPLPFLIRKMVLILFKCLSWVASDLTVAEMRLPLRKVDISCRGKAVQCTKVSPWRSCPQVRTYL